MNQDRTVGASVKAKASDSRRLKALHKAWRDWGRRRGIEIVTDRNPNFPALRPGAGRRESESYPPFAQEVEGIEGSVSDGRVDHEGLESLRKRIRANLSKRADSAAAMYDLEPALQDLLNIERQYESGRYGRSAILARRGGDSVTFDRRALKAMREIVVKTRDLERALFLPGCAPSTSLLTDRDDREPYSADRFIYGSRTLFAGGIQFEPLPVSIRTLQRTLALMREHAELRIVQLSRSGAPGKPDVRFLRTAVWRALQPLEARHLNRGPGDWEWRPAEGGREWRDDIAKFYVPVMRAISGERRIVPLTKKEKARD